MKEVKKRLNFQDNLIRAVLALLLLFFTNTTAHNVFTSREYLHSAANVMMPAHPSASQNGIASLKTSIPNKSDMTIMGCISCNGVGVKNVEVSDGILVTTTNEKGIYYLPSKKKNRIVFITVPSGYEVPNDGNSPLFYAHLKGGKNVEEVNFSLTRVDNDKHAVLALADFHLAKRRLTDDIKQFSEFAADVNSTVADLFKQGYHVYVMSLGDESWDTYWYDNSFALPESFKQIQQINAPTFHCMGNHDNDPYCADDWLAEQAWYRVCGPPYYSFNIGKTHYIVLDDIQYLNTSATFGTIGKRDYNALLIPEEAEWLKKDLSLIKDKSTPVIVGMHAPIYDYPQGVNPDGTQVDSYNMTNAKDFISYFKDFTNVQILTGHKHMNYNVIASKSLMEHNTGAVCATWWWTGKLVGNHICCDGTPGGYGVYCFNKKDLTWYYKSKGYDRNYQFRSYDLNTTYINPEKYAPKYVQDMKKYSYEYAKPSSSNEVMLNVWNYDSKWKIEVEEDGHKLPVTRVMTYDPLHIISYNAQRIREGGAEYLTFPTYLTAHLFKVKASSSTSTLHIKVTDRFGNVYKETMTRPKSFGYDIK
jgi:hypothetical protein